MNDLSQMPEAGQRIPSGHAAVAARRAQVKSLIEGGLSVGQAARELRVPVQTIYNDIKVLQITPTSKARAKSEGFDKAARKRAGAAERGVAAVRDRRRFKTVPVAIGLSRMAPHDATGTMFPSRVFDPTSAETVLKDGSSNAKIGGDVLVGRLKGARTVTLTLEERATCPTTCALWTGCYGNSMQYSRRWKHGPALESLIEAEIADLCAAHAKILVRLHVLGDFYSFDYLALWARLLDEHPSLHVFGFTAWGLASRIGAGVARLRQAYPDRFCVRTSGTSGPWGSFTIDFPTEKTRLGSAVVCPEQVHAISKPGRGTHCGSCGLCWAGSAPIVFMEH